MAVTGGIASVTFEEAVARVTPHGTFGGARDGCWWLSEMPRTTPFARGPGSDRMTRTLVVRGIRLTGHGRMAGATVRVAAGRDCQAAIARALEDASGDPGGAMLGACLLDMVSVAGTYPDVALAPPVDPTPRPTADDVVVAATGRDHRPERAARVAKAALRSVRDLVRGFVEGHGADVHELLHGALRSTRKNGRGDVSAALGATWHLVDRRCDPDTPLLRALSAYPPLAGLLVDEAVRDPASFVRDIAADNVAAIAARHPTVRGKLPHGLALRLPDLAKAVMAAKPDETRIGFDISGGTQAFLSRMLLPLASLPGNWVPTGDAGWAAYLDTFPTLQGLDVPEDAKASFLAVHGDWPGFARRLAKASGGVRPDAAVRDVRDMHAAFARQVVLPALRATGAHETSEREPALLAHCLAKSILSNGRTLCTVLDTSREWHRRRTAIEAVVASTPGRKAIWDAWEAWLPDHVSGDMGLRVLVTERDLVAEGDAMGHCVGGYAADCGRGACRIASVTGTLPDGTHGRLATLDLRFDRRSGTFLPVVHELRGHHNHVPDPRCRPFVDGYVAMFRDAILQVGGDPLPDYDHHDMEEPFEDGIDEVGYDWVHPGNREEVLAAWRPVLPQALRKVTVGDYDLSIPDLDLDSKTLSRWNPVPVDLHASQPTPGPSGMPGIAS